MFRASDNIPYMTPYSSGYPTLKEKRKRNKSSLLSPHVAVPTTNYSRAPDTVKVKSEPRAGQESSILKLVLGDEEGCVCQLTAWRDTAEVWGRYLATSSPHDSRFKPGPSTTVATTTKPPPPDVTLTGSPSLRPPSRTQTCYRTLPTIRTDARLRLDRRLQESGFRVKDDGLVGLWWMPRQAEQTESLESIDLRDCQVLPIVAANVLGVILCHSFAANKRTREWLSVGRQPTQPSHDASSTETKTVKIP
ncbi:hypothetical protein EDD17DRAFT_1510427 [Pisolithus thermaeus]|nr:hypothetical protein EDD17DRAFT_1510427 [Pisolithus thermaeus]